MAASFHFGWYVSLGKTRLRNSNVTVPADVESERILSRTASRWTVLASQSVDRRRTHPIVRRLWRLRRRMSGRHAAGPEQHLLLADIGLPHRPCVDRPLHIGDLGI